MMQHLSETRVRELFNKFESINVLIVGDLMLDRFVQGTVARISPEAPVPIVEVIDEFDMPGGSANVANNISMLGAKTFAGGVIGDDLTGTSLKEKLRDRGVELSGIVTDTERSTTLKTRIIAHNQQVVRVDNESKAPVSAAAVKRIIEYAGTIIEQLDAIVIEDYGKGAVVQPLVDELVKMARRHHTIVTADPKKGHEVDYSGVTVITPNRAEAYWMAGKEPGEALHEVGETLLSRWSLRGVLITLGEHGMCLFQPGKAPVTIPTTAREVYDVSGAGDTVIATYTTALAAGATMKEAATIANYAAGIVVGKVGTATVSRNEILKAGWS